MGSPVDQFPIPNSRFQIGHTERAPGRAEHLRKSRAADARARAADFTRRAGRDRPKWRWARPTPSALGLLRRRLALAGQGLLGAGADDADDPPSLQLRQGAGLHDLDRVADVRLVLLVV